MIPLVMSSQLRTLRRSPDLNAIPFRNFRIELRPSLHSDRLRSSGVATLVIDPCLVRGIQPITGQQTADHQAGLRLFY
jgi:hypothetical protein